MNEEMRQLFLDMGKVKDSRELAEFLKDLLTDDELRMISQRWQIARGLWGKEISYRDLAGEVGTSVATVSRVAYKVWYGGDGLRRILGRVLPRKLAKREVKGRGSL
jgi:TrpR-related protein YerC/YecD